MNWNSARTWASTVVRLALGAIWLWAGLSKIHTPRSFVQTVRTYDATPEWLSRGIGYGLPILEICLGVLLILGVCVRLSAAVSAVLFVVFLIGVAQAGARGIKLECGCFGGGGQTAGATTYTWDILRDVGLLILAAYLVWWHVTRLGIESFLARNDYVAPPSAKQLRSEGGQRKYRTAVEAKEKAARERSRYISASIGIVVVLIVLIGIGVQSGRSKVTVTTAAANASVSNGVVYGAGAAATVDVYEDFQCPHCLEFEGQVATQLDKDVLANLAQVRFHTLAFLDADSSGNDYSTRAANAALCVSDVSVDDFVKFHNLLFTPAVQPAEGSHGRTDNDFIKYAQQVGLNPTQVTTFTACINSQKYKSQVQAITDDASKKGINSTPTVKVNGKTLSSNDLPTLEKAIAAADAKGPKPSKSPVPTTSAPAASGAVSPAVSTPGASTPGVSTPAVASPSGSPSPTK